MAARKAPGASQDSAKGLVRVVIDGGTLSVDAADDAVHSNASVVLHSGQLALASGDDGIHADSLLYVAGGSVDISTSYEGLESTAIAIVDGDIRAIASDDGINVAGGDGSAALEPGGGVPGASGDSSDCYLLIEGGRIVLDASGDGLDSNGALLITGGSTIVNGPTGSANAAIDAGRFSIEGGTLLAVHTEQMADEIDGSLSQNLLRASLDSTISGDLAAPGKRRPQ